MFVAFVAALLASPALAENTIKVCIELPSGTLQVKTAPLGAGQCDTLASPHQAIGVWSFWEQPVGNQLAEEWSGHDLFGCFDANGDTVIQERDTTGADKGTRRKPYTPNAAPGQLRTLPDAVADTAAAGDVTWDVANGGAGAAYETKLASCRTLVGFPP